MVSPHGELWTPIYIPLCNDTGLELIHYTWGGVYVLEALALLFPGIIHIMWDHDAAPTSLWEVQDLCTLFAQAHPSSNAPVVYAISENNSSLNAGVVIFPAETPLLE